VLGYKLVKVEAKPAEAWRELKQTANHLAESICQMITRMAREAEQVSGQPIQRLEIQKGSFRISSLRDWHYTPSWKANWNRIQVYHDNESWCLSLPDRESDDNPYNTYWPVRASVARMVVEMLASISEQDIQTAVDEALENNTQ